MRAVDCMGFAGGFTLGTVQAGFELVGKKEMPGGFGVPNCEANRHLLGYGWSSQVCDPAEWEPMEVELVFGNPPCSGFSTMSPKAFRGMDSEINKCMWAFAEYTARCMPQVAIFESVQPAYTKGRPLMQSLRARVEELTGVQWNLHHVKHSAASLGGTSGTRRRYFWLVSRIPFGVERVSPERVPSLRSVIGDLQGLATTWEPQPYRSPASWWAESRRSESGLVDGHQWRSTLGFTRAMDLLAGEGGEMWSEGERLNKIVRRFYEKHGKLPDSWNPKTVERLIRTDFWCGVAELTRWYYDKPAYVITGAGMETVIHPELDRTVTHREVARIMGFPDDWRIWTLRDWKSLHPTWGKGIPVDCGRWISSWAKHSIEGEPGSYSGDEIGEREYLIDVTDDWKSAVVV